MKKEILESILRQLSELEDTEIVNCTIDMQQGDALNKGTISLTVDFCKRVELESEGNE